ncbi:hypothetical protein ACYZUD_01985 [Pseudomonas sp. XS1P51]
MTLVADDLRNQQGQLNAQGGKLKVNSSTFDHTQGDARADNVEVTSTTRLTNDRGHLVATTGNLELKRGEILNNSGELSARQQLQVDADKLKNLQGNLSAEVIGLTLSDALDNDNSLIESRETLGIDAGTLTSLNGKLRALGSKDRSQFKVGGHFNNDNGLVEIGNDRFALDSSSLSNQQGTVRHLGTQGFDLSLADSHNVKIFCARHHVESIFGVSFTPSPTCCCSEAANQVTTIDRKDAASHERTGLAGEEQERPV